MDKETIKTTLAGYLPELYKDDDPIISEALRLARADKELSLWLDEEIAFDRQFAECIRRKPAPEGAKEALLGKYYEQTKEEKVVKVPFWRRRSVLLSIAAALALLGALVKYLAFPPPVEFPQTAETSVETFRDQMAYFANERFMLSHFTKSLTEAQQYLEEKGVPVYDEVPDTLVGFQGMGCKAIDWGDHQVGLVCFKNKDGDIVHLFTVDKSAIIDHLNPATPAERMLVKHGLETGGWVTKDHVFMLVGSEPGISIKPFQSS